MLDKLIVKLMVLRMRLSDDRGQDLAEYALLTGGIAILIVGAVAAFEGALDDWFRALADKLPLT